MGSCIFPQAFNPLLDLNRPCITQTNTAIDVKLSQKLDSINTKGLIIKTIVQAIMSRRVIVICQQRIDPTKKQNNINVARCAGSANPDNSPYPQAQSNAKISAIREAGIHNINRRKMLAVFFASQ